MDNKYWVKTNAEELPCGDCPWLLVCVAMFMYVLSNLPPHTHTHIVVQWLG